MLRNSTKIIATIGIAVLLVSVAVYGIFFLMVSKHKTDHIALSTERAEARAHKESLQKLMRVLDETSTERESLKGRFIEEDGVIDLLGLVETLGREQGVSLTTDSLTVQPGNSYFETLVIKISVEGQYAQVLGMLSLLEALPYQTVIYRTQVQRVETGDWRGVYEIGVTKFKPYEG